MSELTMRSSRLVLLLTALFLASETSTASAGQGATPAGVPAAALTLLRDREIADVRLVRATVDLAVVRVGDEPLQTIHVGDRLGRTRAEVKEITRGRMVLEETFTGADGGPNTAEIIFKDGQKGGTRYLRRPDEKRPLTVRPVVIDPPKEAGTEK